MSMNCDPCQCPDMYYRSTWPWRKAMLILLCRIRTILDDAIIDEEASELPPLPDSDGEGGDGNGQEPSPQGD